MAFDPVSAGVEGGVSLLSGLFGGLAERKKQQRELAQRRIESGLGITTKGIENMSNAQQQAFSNLVGALGKGFGVG